MTDKDYVIKKWNITAEDISLAVSFKKHDVFHGFIWNMRLGFDYLSGNMIFPASNFGSVSSEARTYRNSHTQLETENFYRELLAFMDITEYEYHDGEKPYCIISTDVYKNVLTLWKMKERC